MSYRYSFDPVALAEYKEAIEWYGEKNVTALDAFIAALNVKIKAICFAPTLYRTTYKKQREVSLNKFPYAVVYSVDENAKMITITSVYHHKRNPRRKYKKQ